MRLFSTEQDLHLVYVMLIEPKPADESYDDYRKFRIATLHAYTSCAKLKCLEGITFVGLAFDHPNKDYEGGSEDLFFIDYPTFSEEDRMALNERREAFNIWHVDAKIKRVSSDEYPFVASVSFDTNASVNGSGGATRKNATKRNRARAAKVSRKANRRNRR